MKKGADLEIKAFDLNSKMKSMLVKYKSKGLNDRDAYLSNIVDQFGGVIWKKYEDTLVDI